jgi:hypothetical protein
MSKDQVSNEVEQEVVSDQETEEQFVAKKAYEEVAKDMHRFKSSFKEAKAKLAEYEAKLQAQEEAKLKEQQKWQELYEREKKEREKVFQERQKEKDLYARAVKLSALKAELGGKIRDEYLSHADISAIEFTENGTVNPDTVRDVANRFRQEHSQLIPSSSSTNITGRAPASEIAPQPDRPLSALTFEEKLAELKRLRNQQ